MPIIVSCDDENLNLSPYPNYAASPIIVDQGGVFMLNSGGRMIDKEMSQIFLKPLTPVTTGSPLMRFWLWLMNRMDRVEQIEQGTIMIAASTSSFHEILMTPKMYLL